jgi:imidazoleglycerol-phosphate dehydratase
MNAPVNETARKGDVTRDTAETQIRVQVNLDGTGVADLSTGIGFFDHMLDQIARHGLIDLTIQAKGDLHIDGHHTVEDVGITLGQAVAQAVGDKRGIMRYGHAYVPLDEALSRVVIAFSGRPGLHMAVPFKSRSPGPSCDNSRGLYRTARKKKKKKKLMIMQDQVGSCERYVHA